jgi:hypothetical protein
MHSQNQRSESGQSIIIIAFIVLVLLALVALVVDVGNAYAQRRIVQNAVDSAAMAGALKLIENDPNGGHLVSELAVWQAINDFATDNGLTSDKWVAWFVDSTGAHAPNTVDQFMMPVPSWANGVEVEGQLPFNTYFAHLLGFDVMEAAAEAAAWILQGPCDHADLFPMTVNVDNFPDDGPDTETDYVLMGGSPNVANDDFWWVHWDPRGSDDTFKQGPSSVNLEWNLGDPARSDLWSVGNWVQRADGINSFPSAACILAGRIRDDGTLLSSCDSKMPDTTLVPTVTIPLFDMHSTACPADEDPETCGQPGNTEAYRIVGFAQFRLTCYYHSDHEQVGDCGPCEGAPNKCVYGKFVGMIDPDTFVDGCMPTGIVSASFRQPH